MLGLRIGMKSFSPRLPRLTSIPDRGIFPWLRGLVPMSPSYLNAAPVDHYTHEAFPLSRQIMFAELLSYPHDSLQPFL
jgi:hypothetical protein